MFDTNNTDRKSKLINTCWLFNARSPYVLFVNELFTIEWAGINVFAHS